MRKQNVEKEQVQAENCYPHYHSAGFRSEKIKQRREWKAELIQTISGFNIE